MRLSNIQFKKFKFLSYTLAIFVIIIDQLSKYIINLQYDILLEGVYINDFLNLVFVINKGISFGLLSQFDISRYLGILSILISFFIMFWIWRSIDVIEVISLGLILGGAIGNGIDRIFNTFVIDFIDLHLNDFHWPTFNFADTFITLGAIILIGNSIFASKKLKN